MQMGARAFCCEDFRVLESKLLFVLSGKETKSYRWNNKSPMCFPLPQLPHHSSARSVQLGSLHRESIFPHLQTIVEILNIFFFVLVPDSTSSFLQPQLKKPPFPVPFCHWGSGSPLSGHCWGVQACWSANSLGCSAWKPTLARGAFCAI